MDRLWGYQDIENILATFLAEISVGPEQFYKNMAVLPLLANQETKVEFITLDDALGRNLKKSVYSPKTEKM